MTFNSESANLSMDNQNPVTGEYYTIQLSQGLVWSGQGDDQYIVQARVVGLYNADGLGKIPIVEEEIDILSPMDLVRLITTLEERIGNPIPQDGLPF